jgi:pyrimidine deaminase RibD-like protein
MSVRPAVESASTAQTATEGISRRLASLAELAFREALKSRGKHRHGAVVLSGGRVLAKACNNYDNERHAEVRALKRVPHDALESVDQIIVVRAMKSRKYGLSKPCPDCQKAIKDANVKVVYYSTDGDVLGFETFQD